MPEKASWSVSAGTGPVNGMKRHSPENWTYLDDEDVVFVQAHLRAILVLLGRSHQQRRDVRSHSRRHILDDTLCHQEYRYNLPTDPNFNLFESFRVQLKQKYSQSVLSYQSKPTFTRWSISQDCNHLALSKILVLSNPRKRSLADEIEELFFENFTRITCLQDH
jgi:hypothetical protein